MSFKRFNAVAGAAGLALVVLLAVPTAAAAAPSSQDTAFMVAAHQSNLAEIAGGGLAQNKGQSQQVKDLGARFVADHTQLDNALKQTAATLGVTLPNTPNAQQQALTARYQAASGTDFDALFVSTQIDAHMKAMQNGQTELAKGSDAQAKKAAQDAAPVIAAHHDLLNAAARDLGVPTRIGTGTGGLAARQPITATTAGLLTAGLLLIIGAIVMLRRRPLSTSRPTHR